MVSVRDVVKVLEDEMPLSWQESYDNSGLIVGEYEQEVSGILVALDCTEEVLKEAERCGSNLIISHHPILFKGIKKLTGSSEVERLVMAAIRKGIAIYAGHTNWDSGFSGVNQEIAKRIGLGNLRVLQPKSDLLLKLICYCPKSHTSEVLNAMFQVGAGRVGNYSECSFRSAGTGTFTPEEGAKPFTGTLAVRSEELEDRIEVLVEEHVSTLVIQAMKAAHPYEEVAYDLIPLKNTHPLVGSGMVGEFSESIDETAFLNLLKEQFGCRFIRHTKLSGNPIKRVALCGGSGAFLLKDAIRSGADAYVSGDFKYHEFFDAENKLLVADIGHYESEQYTSELIAVHLKKNFPNFAVRLTEVNTNPINYF